MAKKIIKFSIDVTKIDKRRIIEKDGRKWYNFTAIENESKYSDWMVTEDITADERNSGMKSTILGNGKNWERKPDPDKPYSNSQNDPF
jgi:hypothetical protein